MSEKSVIQFDSPESIWKNALELSNEAWANYVKTNKAALEVLGASVNTAYVAYGLTSKGTELDRVVGHNFIVSFFKNLLEHYHFQFNVDEPDHRNEYLG